VAAAADRPGLLRAADKGVLFLDEIGELGLDEQAMILRAPLDHRLVRLLGRSDLWAAGAAGATLVTGFVRAGLPDPVTDDEPDAVTLDDYLIERPSQTVLVRVKGDSMIDAGIFEGDLVVVEKRAAAQKGDIVVAIVDNQFTLKRLDLESGRFVLKPENKAYPVIRPEGALEIFGVMVGLVRKL
jgi:SOS-response transcriptional repressor LexA